MFPRVRKKCISTDTHISPDVQAHISREALNGKGGKYISWCSFQYIASATFYPTPEASKSLRQFRSRFSSPVESSQFLTLVLSCITLSCLSIPTWKYCIHGDYFENISCFFVYIVLRNETRVSRLQWLSWPCGLVIVLRLISQPLTSSWECWLTLFTVE